MDLVGKVNYHFKGKKWEKTKGVKPRHKPFQVTPHAGINVYAKENNICYYCGKAIFPKRR